MGSVFFLSWISSGERKTPPVRGADGDSGTTGSGGRRRSLPADCRTQGTPLSATKKHFVGAIPWHLGAL